MWSSGFRSTAVFANIPKPLYLIRTTPEQFKRRLSPRLIMDLLLVRFSHISACGLPSGFYISAMLEALQRLLLFFLPAPLRLFIVKYRS